MGIISGGRPTFLDLAALAFMTLLGYGWGGIIGGVVFGGSLFVLFLLLEVYVLRPSEKLEELEERIIQLEDEDD